MFRIDGSTAAASPPTPEAEGTPGYFTGGSPGTATPATIVTPDWLNDVQENLIEVLTRAAVTPVKGDADNLADAIEALIRKQDYVLVEEVQPSGTSGGTFTAGDWRTRVLNTKSVDTNAVATLSSNQITLPAGTWRFRISAPGYDCQTHVARLWNVTAAALVKMGTAEDTTSTESTATTRSLIVGQVTLASPSALQVDHRCSVTRATSGLGLGHSFGENIFTQAEFWRAG